ncbi:transcription termination factor 5, mitochondrial-like isoform X1 [Pieris napi]|uniref:transcription termination factor 5, mitochondrial-like isoform X1 n=1 Tax=Pieris napi TaxID=78633 RepID=UPI001FBBD905|nr:transcription termination factor 5, mitochondrial-like isoform X1 [Pieris napi]
MISKKCVIYFAKTSSRLVTSNIDKRYYSQSNDVPFLKFYKNIMGESFPEKKLEELKKTEPNLSKITSDSLKTSLGVLKKFDITPEEACHNPHLLCINIISLDNYGEILKECGFIKILPIHLIRYNTTVKSRTISHLKKEGLIREVANLEETLLDIFQEWPINEKSLKKFSDSTTNILTIRMSVLERYLQWRLSITSDDFAKYCKHYLPLKHRPMNDIRQSLELAENVIKLDRNCIIRNGCIISSDPVNTKLILDNVESLAGIDIKEAIKMVPALLKNNYKALLDIKDLLKEYQISEDAQRRCLRVYCMNPDSVRERLEDLGGMKEYKILSSNPRILSMVVHQKKVLHRLLKFQSAKKQCFSLNSLISSRNIFNSYMTSFGSKVCSRDIAILILTTLNGTNQKLLINDLRRHKYWLHTALNVIYENICMLKRDFNDKVILENCHLLLYPGSEIAKHIDSFQKMRKGPTEKTTDNYNNLNYTKLSDSQVLSLVLYEIERNYHFSGDGIWTNQDGLREQSLNKKIQIHK